MVTNITSGWKWTWDQVEPDFKVSMRSSDEIITSVLEDVLSLAGLVQSMGKYIVHII